MTKCKTCNVYLPMLVADRAKKSFYAPIAEQSDSDTCKRFIHTKPLYRTDHCYYCTKKLEGRIARQETYGFSYAGRDK